MKYPVPLAALSSKTAITRLVTDILDLLDRDWIVWANVLELLAYARGLKPVVRLVANAASREIFAGFYQRQQWPWRWSAFWLEPVLHTPLNDTFTRRLLRERPRHECRGGIADGAAVPLVGTV
ncbi:MAG: hypothetical protein EKK69_08420 [Candidatus Competibacteraceae bacterium]|nr:MAG: hypothetical protein EKK69_08420 [Candidatus Competibacteraceae bacterium]